MGSGAGATQHSVVHDRKFSLAILSREPEAVHVSKAGYLWKRAAFKRTWLKRWAIVRKGVFRYCSTAAETSSAQERVLSGVIVASWKLEQPVCRTSTHKLYGFMVEDQGGKRKLFYCDSQEDRDGWYWYFQNQATKQIMVNDLYTVDWNNMLGTGYFAAVVRAWDKTTGNQVALKIMARKVFKDHLALLGREVAVMHAMGQHDHLLPLRRVMYAKQRLYLVTEYMDGGELAARCTPLQPFSEFDAARIARQVLSALAHLHSLRICHTDIKPENILFASRAPDAPVKVIDFSLAVFFRQPAEPCGTPEFMAPELITNPDEIAKTGWGGEVDMWAFGILVYWMLSGHTPFEASTISNIFVNIELGRWSFRGECWNSVSEDAKTLIRSLLRRNPAHRPSAKALLKHPWICSPQSHGRHPSLDLTARGLHMVQEADCESRAPSPIAVQAAAGPYPQPLSQVRRLPSDEHHLVSQDSAGPERNWGSLPSVIAVPSPRSSASDATHENLCMIELPDSPTWSQAEASPAMTSRSQADEDDDESLHSSPAASPSDPEPPRLWQEPSCYLQPALQHSHSSASSNDRRPHEVIAFSELHKVRGVTDLRRAIIQAEKDRSLPSLVHQARVEVAHHEKGKHSRSDSITILVAAGRPSH